jgi:signal transduction histidine kinase
MAEGRHADAVRLYGLVLDSSTASDDSGLRSGTLHELGALYADLGDNSVALDYLLQALNEAEEAGDFDVMAVVLHSIGVLYGEAGDFQQSKEYLERSLALFREIGQPVRQVEVMRNLGAIYLAEGMLGEALDCEVRALMVYDLLKDRRRQSAAMITIGRIQERQSDPASALSYYRRAAELLDGLDETDDNRLFGEALLGTGRAYRTLGQWDAARFSLEQGLAMAEDSGERRLQYEYHEALSSVLEQIGEHRSALQHLRQYVAVREQVVQQENRKSLAELQMRFDLERELKEEELRRQHDVTRTMIATQESERSRIAGDLHDGIGQLLASVRVNLLRLEQSVQDSDRATHAWNRSMELVHRASRDVRNISHSLSSSTLNELGIESALREIVADVSFADVMTFRVDTDGIDASIPEDITLSLFRVAQELILNVVRHSRANEALVQLIRHDGRVILMVEDNGIGFEPDEPRKGMGTRNVEARVSALNGTVQFDSRPDHGTTVTIEVPIP